MSADTFNNSLRDSQRQMKEWQKDIAPSVNLAKDIGTAMTAAGAAVTGALALMIHQAADYGDAIRDASIRTGETTQQMSAMKYLAEQSGTSFDALQTGLKFLAKNAVAGSDAFKDLGIVTTDVSGHTKSVSTLFGEVTEKLSGMQDGTEKTALMLKLFGKSGTELTEIMNTGKAGIDAATAATERFGTSIGPEAAARADKFNDTMNDMKQAELGLSLAVTDALLPALTDFAASIVDTIVEVKDFTKAHQDLTSVAGEAGIALGVGGALLVGLAALPKVIAVATAAFETLMAILGSAAAPFVAVGAGILYAIKQFYDWKVAVDEINAANKNNIDQTKLAGEANIENAETLRQLGVQVDLTGKTQQEATAIIQKATGEYWAHQQSLKAVETAQDLHSKAVKEAQGIIDGTTKVTKTYREQVNEIVAAHDKAVKAQEANTQAIKDAESAITNTSKADTTFIQALKNLESQGKLTSAMILENSSKIKGLGESTDPVIQKLQQEADKLEHLKAVLDLVAKSTSDLTEEGKKFNTVMGLSSVATTDFSTKIESSTTLLQAMADANVALGQANGMNKMSGDVLSLLGNITILTEGQWAWDGALKQSGVDAALTAIAGVKGAQDEAAARVQAAADQKKASDDYAADVKKANDEVRDSAGAVFDDMLTHGKSVFASVGDLFKGFGMTMGKTMFQDFSVALFGPLQKAFDDFFKTTITPIIQGFGKWVAKELFGDDGKGGSIGSVASAATAVTGISVSNGVGTVAGAGGSSTGSGTVNSASTGWGASIANSIISGAQMGLAMRNSKPDTPSLNDLKDTWVNSAQDPFLRAISTILDPIDASFKAGTETADDAQSGLNAIQQAWGTMQGLMTTWGLQSKDSAEVIKRSHATMDNFMNVQVIKKLQDEITGLKMGKSYAYATNATVASDQTDSKWWQKYFSGGSSTGGDAVLQASTSMTTTGSNYQTDALTNPLLRDFLNGGKYPSFAVGIDPVPYDMTARIHKGEAVIPASENNSGGSRGGGSVSLEFGDIVINGAPTDNPEAFAEKMLDAFEKSIRYNRRGIRKTIRDAATVRG